VLAEWYPKIVALLPSEGYAAPKQFSVVLRPGGGVAATAGTRITANSTWLAAELDREALGALVHEEVHVVQQYRGQPGGRDFKPAPGWLVEGMADYIRWFLYEPQSHGADAAWLRRQRNITLKYDAGYRVTANFINYVIEHHDPKKVLLAKLNGACRQGRDTDGLWRDCTGKTLPVLNAEWKSALEQQLRPGKTS
jgi:Peptidase of plants and bacteria